MTYYNLFKYGKLIAYTYDQETADRLNNMGWTVQTIKIK
jgi:hypothetical protein